MPIGDKIGEDTVADLNQFVHSWIDDLNRRIEALFKGYRVKITIEIEEKKP